MIKTLKNLLKQDKERYSVPRKVQDVIPIQRIWKDGIFQVGNRFSKTYKFSDINYLVASREDKEAMFLAYSELLNSLDSGATTKITINNRRLNKANFEQSILMPMRGDSRDVYRKEYNQMLLDKATGASSPVWYIILGVLMVLMALQTWEVFSFIPSINLISKSKKRGFIGAFLAGILGGIFSSPCSTPVLIALLAIVAGEGNLIWGILLMLLYSIGHSALVMVAGTSIGFVQKINNSEKYKKAAVILKIVMGAAILLIGFYMFWLAF